MVARFKPIQTSPEQKPKKGFEKGRVKQGGRQKGTPNKRTAIISDSALLAGAETGMPEPVYRFAHKQVRIKGKKDKKGNPIFRDVAIKTDEIIGWRQTGRGGLKGYLGWLSVTHPASYVTLLNRILPMQVNLKADITETVLTKFNDVDTSNMTLDQKLAMMGDMVALTKPRAKALPAPRAAPEPQEYEEGEYEDVPGNYKEAAE